MDEFNPTLWSFCSQSSYVVFVWACILQTLLLLLFPGMNKNSYKQRLKGLAKNWSRFVAWSFGAFLGICNGLRTSEGTECTNISNNFQKQESTSTTKHNYHAGELKSDIEVLVWREHAKALEADSYLERV